ncbi:TPA: FAD-binding oxidoreductase, partial [Pseudomonas putida]|nr:FAD-binding oxidoreductase [Pseudomonas putida]
MSPWIDSEVIVMGAGIVGASAALALARRGRSLTLLERGFCGAQSSGVNYGGVRRQGRSLAQLPLSQRAHQIWGELPALIGIDGEYLRSGHLKLARSEADFVALQAYEAASRDHGLDLQLLDRSTLRARY